MLAQEGTRYVAWGAQGTAGTLNNTITTTEAIESGYMRIALAI